MGFAALLAFLILSAIVSYRSAREVLATRDWVQHSERVLRRMDLASANLLKAESAVQGFSINGRASYLTTLEGDIALAQWSLAEAKNLTVDRPSLTAKLARLEVMFQGRFTMVRRYIRVRQTEGLAAANASINTDAALKLRAQITELQDNCRTQEQAVLSDRQQRAAASLRAATIAFWSSTVIGVLLLGGFYLLAAKLLAAQQKLRLAEGRRASLAEGERDRFFSLSLDMLCISSADGYFKRVSAAFTRTLGWSAEEMLTRPFLDLVHPDDREATLAAVDRQVLAGEEVLQFENRYLHKDGSWRTLSWQSVPQPGGIMYATARDITERALLDCQLRAFFSLSADLLLVAGHDGYFKCVNPSWERVLGYTPEELTAVPWLEFVHPEDREASSGAGSALSEGSDVLTFENRYRCKDGSYRWIRWNAVSYPQGQLSFCVGRDVTASLLAEESRQRQFELLRESERVLEEGQQLAKMGNWEFDPSTQKVSWSKHLFALLGVDPALGEQDLASNMAMYVPEDAVRISAALELAAAKGVPYALDLRRVAVDGEPSRWIHAIGKAVLNAEGEVIRLVGSAMDITEKKNAEARLRQLLGEQENANARLRVSEATLQTRSQELVRSNTDLEQFAHVASHDLQEPLRMVASFMRLLEKKYKGQLGEESERWIDHAVDGATRMQDLIHDLLAYARIGSNGNVFASCEVEEIVKRSLLNLQLAIAETGAEVTCDALPAVSGDKVQLVSLFQNLISNGIKYRGDVPPRIHISAQRAGDSWLFSVRDNGIGIEPQYAERIFVMFQRLHTRKAYPGTGIGLALCKRIVERHEGSIRMESVLEQGSTFFFSLPAIGSNSSDLPPSSGSLLVEDPVSIA